MNLELLHIDIQEFINTNLHPDSAQLLLQGIPFKAIDSKLIIEQIEAKKRCEKKLPTWFTSKNIYYPNKLNIEQTSSEIAAKYKASLVCGASFIDLTGGFGVDAYYFSKTTEKVTHCEINTKLSDIVTHNYKALNVSNITCINTDGIEALKHFDKPFDWIYCDPSRRDNAKQKVFLLADCEPNVKTFQSLFLKYAKHVMLKTAPLLDITATLADLKHVKEIHCVAVNNDVKELLWILERNYQNGVLVKTVNHKKENTQNFEFKLNNEIVNNASYSLPLTYLYEPNAAILKVGAFNTVAVKLNINKLHKHSHLYTSESLIEFPGRRFLIVKQLAYNKKIFAKEKITHANITTRNFPIPVSAIRKKLKIKDGGNHYLFFTTNLDNEKIVLLCSKL